MWLPSHQRVLQFGSPPAVRSDNQPVLILQQAVIAAGLYSTAIKPQFRAGTMPMLRLLIKWMRSSIDKNVHDRQSSEPSSIL
jgi:hypothetical protein